MSSGPPSPRLPIAGTPAAIASTNATPNGSSTPGITNRSHVGSAGDRLGIRQLAGEPDAIGHTQLDGQTLQPLAARAVADHEILGAPRGIEQRHRPEHDVVTLARRPGGRP